MDDPGVLNDRASRIASWVKPLAAFAAEYQPIEHVLEPKIQTGCIVTLTAPTGMGKTAWAILLSLAVATGRSDILGEDVIPGRVIFCAFENPDGARMRIMSACAALRIDLAEVGLNLCIIDRVLPPTSLATWIRMAAEECPIRLVVVDTLAAAFDGEDLNSPTQAGNFIRRFRPITALPGRPAVLILAHPRKEAAKGELVPHGAGATLNEVDANLCLWRESKSGLVELHFQGKFRGPEFAPVFYRYVDSTSRAVVNAKGQAVPLTMLRPCIAPPVEQKQPDPLPGKTDIVLSLVAALATNPRGSLSEWGVIIGRKKTYVSELLGKAKDRRLIARTEDGWLITGEGREALGKRSVPTKR